MTARPSTHAPGVLPPKPVYSAQTKQRIAQAQARDSYAAECERVQREQRDRVRAKLEADDDRR